MVVNRRKIPFILYLIFLILNFFYYNISNANPNPPILIKPTILKNLDFSEKFISVGQCKEENSRTFYAKVNGVVEYVAVEEGEIVKKNAVIIKIDTDIANATKDKVESAFTSAQAEYNRDLSLFNKKIISKENLDKVKATLENAKSDWVNALDKYNNMIIKAPFDGNIGVIHAQVGDNIKNGDYLFTLITNGKKAIYVELPQNLNTKVSKDSKVFLLSKAGRIKGDMIAISDYLNDNGSITAKIIFPSDTKIIHGSFVEVEIVFDHHNALAVNEKAVLKNNKGNFVYKISTDNVIEQIYVTTGSRNNDMIEIATDKLKRGDRVVLEGLTKVTDGSIVEISADEIANIKEKK